MIRVCMMNDNFYRGGDAAIAIKRIALSLEYVEFFAAAGERNGRLQDLSWIPEGKYAQFDLKTSNMLVLIRELKRFKQWSRKNGCDLVHSLHRRVSSLRQAAGKPVLYTGHLAFPYERLFGLFHPRQMSAIIRSVAENLLEATGRTMLACISNPVDFPQTIPALALEQLKERAISIVRLEPVKGRVHFHPQSADGGKRRHFSGARSTLRCNAREGTA